ncbi:MAG: hypothetical protein MJB57_08655 [Gemmatimonadetes bacterium]|nr:hypothetical protein [Gemmatimonadota bacterium]
MTSSRYAVVGVVAAAALCAGWGELEGQDANFLLPVPDIERHLREGEFDVIGLTPSRGLEGERTYQATAQFGSTVLQMKYAPAVEGADEFNNRPRYELGAYVVQQLFLDPEDYVVPPTVLRGFPTDVVQSTLDLVGSDMTPPAEPTFDRWPMTLVALQYWLFAVEVPDELLNEDRIESDATYERYLGNFNILTYLIRHNDSNEGNFLRSADAAKPRVYSVDNGVAFAGEESDRGTYWRELRLDRYPAEAIERLRGHTIDDLHDRLGVLVQLELSGGRFVEVEPGENLDPGRGVRHDDTTVQLGLTDGEVRNVHRRITRLLEWIDEGRYEVVP